MSVIEFSKVTKQYAQNAIKTFRFKSQNNNKISNQLLILNDVKLRVENKSIFGLVGLNGTGKTTIIKSLLALVDVTKGEIKINNTPTKFHTSRKDLFYLPEHFMPCGFLRVREFIYCYVDTFYSVNKKSFPYYSFTAAQDLDTKSLHTKVCESHFIERFLAKNNATDRKQKTENRKLVNSAIDFYAKMLDLDLKYLDYKIESCSKGTVQKIGLLTAFLTDAETLVLDEPSTGLDVKARWCLQNTISFYNKLGKTIFLSSHIFSDLDKVCTHFGIFTNKNFVFCGTKDELENEKRKVGIDSFEDYFLSLV
jgi:ABC-2 type transport system ATP-binding protein